MLSSNISLFESKNTFPVQAKGHWATKIVTTLPPNYIPHTEYRFECELVTEELVLVVLLLKDDHLLQFQKLGRSDASSKITVCLSFFPYNWHTSDDVQINFSQQAPSQGGGMRMSVHSESLKQDPRQLVETNVFSAGFVETGKLVDLAVIHLEQPIIAQLVVIPLSETQSTHGRWRLKKIAELPAHLSFLMQGRHMGKVILNR